jgi:hypothetical protein
MRRYDELTPEQLASDEWEQFRELSLADKEIIGESTPEQQEWLRWQGNVNDRKQERYDQLTPEQLDSPQWEQFRELSPENKERLGNATPDQLDWLEWQGNVNDTDTSWDWSNQGQGGVSGIDPGYGQADSGSQMPGNQPGYLSPWGGNADFYRNQFQGLLDDDNEFQRQQGVAQQIRADAAQNPLQNDWDWSKANIPGAGQNGLSWTQRNALSHMTNNGMSPGQIQNDYANNVNNGSIDPLLNPSPAQPAWTPGSGAT